MDHIIDILSKVQFTPLTNESQSLLDGRYKVEFYTSANIADSVHVLKQIHSNHVYRADSLDLKKISSTAGDGLFTQTPELSIGVRTADCLPILFASAGKDDFSAAVHAGWRGFSSGIIERTLKISSQLSVKASDLHVVIGPAISRRWFEIGPEVFDILRKDSLMSEKAFLSCAEKGVEDRWHFDLQQGACLKLIGLGVKPHNILVYRKCTYEESTLHSSLHSSLHSYRKEGKGCSHNFSAITIQN